jgi:signal transduction histidine kinase
MPALETRLLESAFQEFAKASDSIINYYGILEGQIRELKREVEEKNRELERAKEYFYTILNSLPVGVVVVQGSSILFSNKRAERLGSTEFLKDLNNGGLDTGELKSHKGHYRWNKEALSNGFKGRDVIVFEDVTEIEKMKERLERDERLKAMGEMAARIAHEIKNPLGSMELFLSMLNGGKLRPKDRQYVDHILFGVKTIDRIINNMLSYTRPKTLVMREEKLAEVVKDTLDFMSISIRSRDIGIEFSNTWNGRSYFDPDLMKLVVMNLISNAMDAVKENGLIRIEVREEGRHAVAVVADNGTGMAEEVRKNIFNPFFTTKDKGMGLGLFIVHNIVQAHGGYIEAESVENKGSAFFIYIPKDKP